VARSNSLVAGRTARIGACAIALGLAVQPAFAARVVDPASARLAIASPTVVAEDAELTALAASGRATELAARLERIAHDAAQQDVAREWLLDRGLHALARLTPTHAARAAVARLASLPPTVYARIDPDHGGRPAPLYDTGATARFVLRQWDRAAARTAAAADLAAGDDGVVRRFSVRGDPGIAEAFRAAPPTQLAAQRAGIVDALTTGRRVDELALILADRLADPELFALTVDHADETVALAAMPAAARSLDSAAALAILARASRRAGIASGAVLEIGRLAAQDAAARRFLFDTLADSDLGPSAAAALGSLGDPAIAAEVGAKLARAREERERSLLVLALRLDRQPAARAELERFANSGAGSPQLRQEVRQWLER
jgi:hypothetical protein